LAEEFISRFSANVKCDRTWRAVKAILELPRANSILGNCNILRLEGVPPDFETDFNWELIEL
jgi:hypothetical protein